MRLHRILTLVAVALPALALAACAPQAEAADADIVAESPSENASFPLSAKSSWTMERLLALDHESTVALWKTLRAAGMAELAAVARPATSPWLARPTSGSAPRSDAASVAVRGLPCRRPS